MFLLILTLTLCLTKAFVFEDAVQPFSLSTSTIEPIYNIHEWVDKLQLEKCAFVAIGLKFFAIFVEDEITGDCGKVVHRKYFLGVCHQSTLEEWTFCSPNLEKQRKHKCRFRIKANRFEARVHRRFCDISLMVNNKDCQCEPTILGDEMVKVKGFPTCYMPPISTSLCRYNVCGLFKCKTTAIEDRIYSVECSSKCRGANPVKTPTLHKRLSSAAKSELVPFCGPLPAITCPCIGISDILFNSRFKGGRVTFCEYPMDGTSRFPVSRSFWSKWREDGSSESHKPTRKKHFVATCVNKYTGKGDVDCLGPGTGCCPSTNQNCSCDTYEEKGVLKLEKTEYITPKKPQPTPTSRKKTHRHVRAPDDDDIEDDDDEDQDLDDDIALEENTDEEVPITTTEELERDEAAKQLKGDALKELNQTRVKTAEVKDGASTLKSHWGILFLLLITSLCLPVNAIYNFI